MLWRQSAFPVRLTSNVYMQLYGYGRSPFLKERTQYSCMVMLLESREQCNSGRYGASAVGRRVWCRLLRCTSMPDRPVCWNWSMMYGRSLVFDSSCTQLKTEIESRVFCGRGRLLYTFSYIFFHFTMGKMPENSNNSACLPYVDTTFEIGTTYCHLCRASLKNGRRERDANCLASCHRFFLEIDRLFWQVFSSITLSMKTPNYGNEFCDTVLCVPTRNVMDSLGFWNGVVHLKGCFSWKTKINVNCYVYLSYLTDVGEIWCKLSSIGFNILLRSTLLFGRSVLLAIRLRIHPRQVFLERGMPYRCLKTVEVRRNFVTLNSNALL